MNTKARPAPRFSNPGRRARFSYLTTDKEGRPVRAWHDLPYPADGHKDIAKSLRGMVRV